jgi:hypothetical protein
MCDTRKGVCPRVVDGPAISRNPVQHIPYHAPAGWVILGAASLDPVDAKAIEGAIQPLEIQPAIKKSNPIRVRCEN